MSIQVIEPKTIGAPSEKLKKAVKKAAAKSTTGPHPRADINGWVLCPGDAVLIVSPGEEYHGLFGKVDAFPTTLELSSYVQIDGRPSTSGRVLLPNAQLRWMGPDESRIDLHRPTRPGQRVRVVLDNEALATPELKSMEGQLGTVTELNGDSMFTVKFEDPALAAWPAAINGFDLLVVPIPVVEYVPEPVAEAVPVLPPPIEEESDLPWLNKELAEQPAAWLRPTAGDKAHYFAAGQENSLCDNWLVGPHERNPADAAALKHCTKCEKLRKALPGEAPATVLTVQPAYQAPKIVATVPRHGTDGPFEWNEYGVCINPTYAYQAEKGKREFVKIAVAQTPDGDWVTGHDFAAADSGSASPTSLSGERFATSGLAATAGARNILLRSTSKELSASLRKGMENLLSEANEALPVALPQDVRLTTAAWDLLEIIVEKGGYLMQDNATTSAEITELSQAGLIALDTVATTPEATYFLLTTGLSRGQDDATAKKRVCTWHREYFRLDTEFGTLTSVNELEDGLMWFSVGALLPVPARALPSTADVYEAAHKRYLAKAAVKRIREAKEKAFRKQLASGDIYGLRAEEEAAAPESVEASLPQPAAMVPVAGLLDDFTVLDLEFQQDNLLEIAAIRYRDFEPVSELVSFVRFTSPVWSPITQLTGITSLHVYTAPLEKTVLQQFRALAGDSLLICHSISADKRVLEAARTRCGATAELANPWLCTLALARKRIKAGLLPKSLPCKLADLCQHFKISSRGAHRAKRDVEMCAALLRALHAQQPITKADLHGAPVAGKGRKSSTMATPGLFASAA